MNWSPRWRKLAGDALQHRGRIAVMISALAVGVFAVGAISTAYIILAREIDRGFLATNPPASVLEVDRLDRATVDTVGHRAAVAAAEAAGTLWARVEVRPREWLPLVLFVKEDWPSRQIGTVTLEAGRWPTDTQGVVLERSAVAVAGTAVGREILVQTIHGTPRKLTVTGIAHDATVAPAPQHQVVYGYVTPGTVAALGEDSALHSLQITVKSADIDAGRVDGVIVGLARYLKLTGHVVGEIRIPPRHHPHWMLMSHLVAMLLAFSLTTLGLSAVLAATLTAALLAPQVRQIGIMKAVGARSGQIVRLYGTLIALIGLSAVTLGLPAGMYAGRGLAAVVVRNQNMDLMDSSIPVSWVALQIVVGVALPFAACLVVIMKAARRTVVDSLRDDVQVTGSGSQHDSGRFSLPFRWHAPILTLTVRNCVRRRSRLWLTLSLLGAAGALFIATVNVREAWNRNLVDAGIERHFGAQISFAKPESAAAAIRRVMAVAGVERVETFDQAAAALERGDDLRITRTFADGGHGSLRLHGVPVDTGFLTPTVVAGRWLSAADRAGAILNDQALTVFPRIKVGDPLSINVSGRILNLRVAGIVREHLAGATVYVSTDEFTDALGLPGVTDGLRVGLSSQDATSEVNVLADVERSLEEGGFRVVDTTTQAQVGRALAGHLFILIDTLLVMSSLMALVGVLGLASSMTTHVLERRREFGVMRALGASDRSIAGVVVGEGLLNGLLSIGVAALLSVPVTAGIAKAVGNASIGPALGVVLSAVAVPIWTAIVLVSSVLATGFPARTASKLTVRAALQR